MTNFVNLTPHAITLVEGENTLTIPASGQVARCSQTEQIIGKVGGFTVTKITLGAVSGLPDPAKDTIYIVSRIVADAVAGFRSDVLIPGPAIRDAEGRIVGARGLSVV